MGRTIRNFKLGPKRLKLENLKKKEKKNKNWQ